MPKGKIVWYQKQKPFAGGIRRPEFRPYLLELIKSHTADCFRIDQALAVRFVCLQKKAFFNVLHCVAQELSCKEGLMTCPPSSCSTLLPKLPPLLDSASSVVLWGCSVHTALSVYTLHSQCTHLTLSVHIALSVYTLHSLVLTLREGSVHTALSQWWCRKSHN